MRTFAPVVAGIGEMNYVKFLTFNICGGIGWVFLMLMTGFALGRTIPHIDKHVHKVILVVIFVSILPAIIEWWKERKTDTLQP